MPRNRGEYSERQPESGGDEEWGPEFASNKEAAEEFVVGLAARDSHLVGEMAEVLGGNTSFSPSWMKPAAVGVGSVLEVLDVYQETSAGWTDGQRQHVAGAVSGFLVEPAEAFVQGLDGLDNEKFKAEAKGELASAKSQFEEAMLSGDTGVGMKARAVLNQVQRDAEGISRGERI